MIPAFVLDCSAAVALVFEDEASPATERMLDQMADGAIAWVPGIWHLELANVLLGAHRRKRIDQAGIEGFLHQLTMYEIQADQETVQQAWSKTIDLALQHQLSSYDAAYLEIALRRNIPLATLDKALIQAAKATGTRLLLQDG